MQPLRRAIVCSTLCFMVHIYHSTQHTATPLMNTAQEHMQHTWRSSLYKEFDLWPSCIQSSEVLLVTQAANALAWKTRQITGKEIFLPSCYSRPWGAHFTSTHVGISRLLHHYQQLLLRITLCGKVDGCFHTSWIKLQLVFLLLTT